MIYEQLLMISKINQQFYFYLLQLHVCIYRYCYVSMIDQLNMSIIISIIFNIQLNVSLKCVPIT